MGHDDARVGRGARLAACGLAWLVGVAAQLQQAALWPLAHYLAALGLSLAMLAAAWRWPRAVILAWVGAGLLGFGAAGWRAELRWADQLPAALEGQDVVLTGVVAGLPQLGASGLRFRFEVRSAVQFSNGQAVQVSVPQLLSMAWYKGFDEDAALTGPQRALRAGQAWRFTARLKAVHGNLNPQGFDYELYLFEQGVRATGSVRSAAGAEPQLLEAAAGYPVDRLRQWVRDGISTEVSDPRAAGVLAALAVGDQSAIERDDWQVFRATGVAHLMSISGLHVTMFAWLAGGAIRWLWRRSGRAVLWLPAQSAARWAGLLAALAYAVFSGWGVPAQRTVWMLATVMLLLASGRRWPWPMVLLAAAVVVSALDPWALLQPGFWLSFMAVGLLMASGGEAAGGEASDPASVAPAFAAPASAARAAPWWRKLGRAALAGLRTQGIATIGLAPLTLVFFQQISLVGFAANLVAIPVVTLLITPLALLGVVCAPLWWLGAAVVQQLSAGLQWLGAVPWAVWTVPAAPLWAQMAGLLGAALMVSPLPWRVRMLALALVVPLLWPTVVRPAMGRYEVLAVDVGQGSAVLVRTQHHLMVYDTGPQYSRESNAGQRVLLPLLQARGETRIDRLVLSHRDADHVGGAAVLLKQLPVIDLLSSLELGHPLLALAPQATRCDAGQSWQWDGVRFDVLHPAAADHGAGRKSNALSCVLRVSGAQGSVLLAGDVEREQELRLVAAHAPGLAAAHTPGWPAAPVQLTSDVLLVPHHGSRTSSSAPFLEAVAPQVAVVQAGYRNRFGHPVPEVMARLHARGAQVAQNTSCGAWHWDGTVPPTQAVCERALRRRYWHHEMPLD